MAGIRLRISFVASLLLTLFFFTQCGSKTVETDYYKNQQADKANPWNQEDIIAAVGADKYYQLQAGIGESELNTLLNYGGNTSNTIILLTQITDITDVIQLLSGPRKLTAIDITSLMNRTDWHIRNFRYFGFAGEGVPLGDTIGKMAKLLTQVNDMQGLKDMVHGAKDNASGPAHSQNKYDRLAYILANTDEDNSIMPTIINRVMLEGSGPYTINISGRDALTRMINDVDDLGRVTQIIAEVVNVNNMVDVLVWLENDGQCVNGTYANQFDCEYNSFFWTNCSNTGFTTRATCEGGGHVWDIGGTDAMGETVNNVTNISKMAYLINELATTTTKSNDENFDTASDLGIVPTANQAWASTGSNDRTWVVVNDSAQAGGQSASTPAALLDGEVSALEYHAYIPTADDGVTACAGANCPIRFHYRVSSEAGGDYFKFYVNNNLELITSGNVGWTQFTYNAPAPGNYRLRWEYIKNGSVSSGSDRVWIDSVVLPGNHGATRTSAQKVAIMLNKLYVDSIQNVADIMNQISPAFVTGTPPQWGLNAQNAGMDNLIYIMDQVEFPLNINDMPNMIQIVNDLQGEGANNGIDTMVGILENITPPYTDPDGGGAQIVNVMNFSDPNKVVTLMNGLVSANAAAKITAIVNGLNNTGTNNMAQVTGDAGANIDYMVDLIDGVTVTDHIADILNNLFLNGKLNVVAGPAGPTGALKMSQILNAVEADASLTREYHLTRMINDIGATPGGAKNTGIIVGSLDSNDNITAAMGAGSDGMADGVNRMVKVMSDLALHPSSPNNTAAALGDNVYNSPLQFETTDHFGRLTTLVNEMQGTAPQTVAWLVNGVNDTTILSYIMLNIDRVEYMSYMINNLDNGNIQLLLDLLNDPSTNRVRVTDIMDYQGNLSYGAPPAAGTAPAVRYTNQMTDDARGNISGDPLGRMVVLISSVASSQGISNVVTLLNDVTDWQGDLLYLVNYSNRLQYLTDTIQAVTNISLMVSLLNDGNLDITNMENIIDTMGDWTYSGGTGPGYKYGDNQTAGNEGLDTRTGDALGRMAVLINEVTSGAGVTNITRSINEICDIDKLTGLVAKIIPGTPTIGVSNPSAHPIGGGDRVRYMSDIMNNVVNIDLMINMLNGPNGAGNCSGAPNPPIDYTRLNRLINDIGGTTEQGTIGKNIGEMDILWGSINELGFYGAADQTKMITIVNSINYCGIRPQYDTTIPDYPGAGYFYPCNSTYTGCGNVYQNGRWHNNCPRLSKIMRGMNSAYSMAVIAGGVPANNINRTVGLMDGAREADTLVALTNLLPGEVMRDLVIELEDYAVHRGMNYMINNLTPESLAALTHFGTGIGRNTSRTGTCYYFPGLGPRRTARLLNLETGPTLQEWIHPTLGQFGYRTGIASVACGFSSPYAGEPQTMCNWYSGSENCGIQEQFYRTESITIANDPHYNPSGNYTHSYEVRPRTTGVNGACKYYYDGGKAGVDLLVCAKEDIVDIVWDGVTLCGVAPAGPGLAAVWDMLNGRGFLGWIYDQAGTMDEPPGNKDWDNCRLNLTVDGTGKSVHPAVQWRNTSNPGDVSDTKYNYNPNGAGTGYGWHGGQPTTSPNM